MPLRFRLMMGATALLYLGPLLAGLAGYGWAAIPAFAGIFLLWLLVLRPDRWQRGSRVRFAGRIAGQILLVAACFGIGRGIGGVAGADVALPMMLPVAVSFLAIPISRLLWSPVASAEHVALLEAALHQLAPSPTEASAFAAMERASAQKIADQLLALPADTPDEVLLGHLEQLPREAHPGVLAAIASRIPAARAAA